MISYSLCADLAKRTKTYAQLDCPLIPIDRARPKGASDSYPNIQLKEGVSGNWSGYAAATSLSKPEKKSVTQVSGSWVVPALAATPEDSYCSIWVGMDGYASESVEQIGTEHDWISGGQQNYAWFEMYPDTAYLITEFPVDIGDQIYADVKYTGKDTFKLSLFNITKKVFTVIPSQYTKAKNIKRSSAEWVVEAPSDQSGVLPLANFVTANFANCTATINGKIGTVADRHWEFDAIVMEGENNVVKAIPSELSKSGMDFSVVSIVWENE